MTTDTRKAAILAALRKFIAQRPGMDPRNYGSAASYRQEYREVLRDKHDAETLLRALERDSITADDILREAGGGGRLTIEEFETFAADPGGDAFYEARRSCGGILERAPRQKVQRVRVSYCTGQYFPTEYRKAVARLAAAVLWAHVREHGMPQPSQKLNLHGYDGTNAGDWLRAYFHREFGRHLAARYFT